MREREFEATATMIEDLQNQYDHVSALRDQASDAEKKRAEETRISLISEQEKVAKLQVLVEKLQMENDAMNKKLIDLQAEKVTIMMEKMQLEEALAEDSPMKGLMYEGSPVKYKENQTGIEARQSLSDGERESRETSRLKKALEAARVEILEMASTNGSEVLSAPL